MVNVLERATSCTDVRRSEGKNRFFGNLWTTLRLVAADMSEKMGYGDAAPVGIILPQNWSQGDGIILGNLATRKALVKHERPLPRLHAVIDKLPINHAKRWRRFIEVDSVLSRDLRQLVASSL